jgi:hypothetical protein
MGVVTRPIVRIFLEISGQLIVLTAILHVQSLSIRLLHYLVIKLMTYVRLPALEDLLTLGGHLIMG